MRRLAIFCIVIIVNFNASIFWWSAEDELMSLTAWWQTQCKFFQQFWMKVKLCKCFTWKNSFNIIDDVCISDWKTTSSASMYAVTTICWLYVCVYFKTFKFVEKKLGGKKTLKKHFKMCLIIQTIHDPLVKTSGLKSVLSHNDSSVHPWSKKRKKKNRFKILTATAHSQSAHTNC